MLLTATTANLSNHHFLPLRAIFRGIANGVLKGAAATIAIAWLTLLFSAPAYTQQETPPADASTTDPDEASSANAKPAMMAESRLDKTLPAEQKVTLTVDGHSQRAYYLKETSGKAHGGIIIVPELNQHPANSGEINTLRHVLADRHWHTLALNHQSSDLASASKLIAAAVNYLNQQGIYNIALLSQGGSAVLAVNYVANLPAPPPGEFQQLRALILLNAKNQVVIAGQPFNSLNLLSEVKLPVLDAYNNSDFQQKQHARQRKTIGRQHGKRYQQARLPLSDYSDTSQDNRVTKRIRGWLDTNIAGFMIDKR